MLHPPICVNMVGHMKTTVEIADSLLSRAREICEREGTTLKALIDEGLRAALERRRGKKAFRLRDESYGSGGMHPNVRDGGWEKIRDAAYEGRGS